MVLMNRTEPQTEHVVAYIEARKAQSVSTTEVCDNIMRCPNGDNEQMCELPRCPAICSCCGKRVLCRRPNLSVVPVFETSA